MQRKIKEWNKQGRKKKLRTARATYLGMNTKLGDAKANAHKIDFSQMKNILDVNEDDMTILCEPGVNMGQLTFLLESKHLALLIQVEMESLTVGGLVLGVGMETNSHKFGLIQETVVGYEILLSNGELKWVTEESDPELFWTMPWSYGSIGFLTAVRLKMQRTKPYIHMQYISTRNLDDLQEQFEKYSLMEDAPFFLEATVYNKDEAVIQLGRYVDYDPKTAHMINTQWWFKPWYYKHVEKALTEGDFEEILPTRDYYHRFTKSIFWELEEMIPFGNHWLYRYFWAWMGAPEVSLLKYFQGPIIRKASIYAHVVQDIIIPIKEVKQSVVNFHEWFNTYPLLIFPMKICNHGKHDGMLTVREDNLQPGKEWGMYFDLGAYGVPQLVREKKPFDAVEAVRKMEAYTREVNGWQCLYSDTFQTEEEFEQMFNCKKLHELRKKFDAETAFPTPYEKIAPEPGLNPIFDNAAKK